MEYSKLRNKIGKFYKGGKIPKYQAGGVFDLSNLVNNNILNLEIVQKLRQQGFSQEEIDEIIAGSNSTSNILSKGNPKAGIVSLTSNDLDPAKIDSGILTDFTSIQDIDDGEDERNQALLEQMSDNLKSGHAEYGTQTAEEFNHATKMSQKVAKASAKQEKLNNFKSGLNSMGQAISGVDFSADASWRDSGLSEGGAMGMGIAAKAGTAVFNAVDQATMGDKNFGAGSQAVDSLVHGASSALISSGNPYAMLAGAALEGANFLTKAGGQTVQGYDVNIENSGFGTLGHQESQSSRSWFFGLNDITGKGMEKKLAKRNEQARMAMKAAEISEDVKFEQEARMNSVDNVLRNNQIALAGGIDTSLLGS